VRVKATTTNYRSALVPVNCHRTTFSRNQSPIEISLEQGDPPPFHQPVSEGLIGYPGGLLSVG
jgi:hypothetical protein